MKEVNSTIDDELVIDVTTNYLSQPHSEESLLYVIRFSLENAGETVSCSVFKDFPKAAYKAFNAYWGSLRDHYYHCPLNKYKEDLPYTFSLIDIIEQLDNVEGSRKYAHERKAHTYIIKSIVSPEYSLKDVGLKKYNIDKLKNAKVLDLLNQAINELTLYHTKQYKVDKEILKDKTIEVLNSYIGYRIEKGSVDQ